jgi:hypothetical protein
MNRWHVDVQLGCCAERQMRLTDRIRGNGSGEPGMIDTSMFGNHPADYATHYWDLGIDDQRTRQRSLEVDNEFVTQLTHLETLLQPSLRDPR